MTKQEFKRRFESNEDAGGLTMDDVADCYVAWGLGSKPRIQPMDMVRYRVLKAANVTNADDYEPEE